MPDVIDFLVLLQFYNEAKEHNWQPGQCSEGMCPSTHVHCCWYVLIPFYFALLRSEVPQHHRRCLVVRLRGGPGASAAGVSRQPVSVLCSEVRVEEFSPPILCISSNFHSS